MPHSTEPNRQSMEVLTAALCGHLEVRICVPQIQISPTAVETLNQELCRLLTRHYTDWER